MTNRFNPIKILPTKKIILEIGEYNNLNNKFLEILTEGFENPMIFDKSKAAKQYKMAEKIDLNSYPIPDRLLNYVDNNQLTTLKIFNHINKNNLKKVHDNLFLQKHLLKSKNFFFSFLTFLKKINKNPFLSTIEISLFSHMKGFVNLKKKNKINYKALPDKQSYQYKILLKIFNIDCLIKNLPFVKKICFYNSR